MISWSQPLSDSEAEESVGVEVSMLPKDEDIKPVAKEFLGVCRAPCGGGAEKIGTLQ